MDVYAEIISRALMVNNRCLLALRNEPSAVARALGDDALRLCAYWHLVRPGIPRELYRARRDALVGLAQQLLAAAPWPEVVGGLQIGTVERPPSRAMVHVASAVAQFGGDSAAWRTLDPRGDGFAAPALRRQLRRSARAGKRLVAGADADARRMLRVVTRARFQWELLAPEGSDEEELLWSRLCRACDLAYALVVLDGAGGAPEAVLDQLKERLIHAIGTAFGPTLERALLAAEQARWHEAV